MKLLTRCLCVLFLCFFSVPVAFAQVLSPSPANGVQESASGSGVLNSFIAGFDWISSGLIFYTPSIMDNTITLKDGTELTGMTQFRTIFYDVAVPIFVLITSFIAFSHISNDNAAQLKQFFQRLLLVIVLFIITPAILSYSIQFINLLNEKIIAQNSYNLSTLVNNFLSSYDEIPMFQNIFGISVLAPTWNTVLELIVLIISVGFLLIGFIYIIFQAVIRFIALLILSVLFPIVLPFALSEKTENIANTYFRTWFSFLIQQPAFVLGFAIVSTILTSILQAHNNNIGTLFVYSGSLIFLGGINVFIGRIFGEGWSMVSTNAQSIAGSRIVNKNVQGLSQRSASLPSYASKFIREKLSPKKEKNEDGEGNQPNASHNLLTKKTENKTAYVREKLQGLVSSQNTVEKQSTKTFDSKKTETTDQQKTNQPKTIKEQINKRGENQHAAVRNRSAEKPQQQKQSTPQQSKLYKIKHSDVGNISPIQKSPIKQVKRKKISL